jgi:alpha-galactosidase
LENKDLDKNEYREQLESRHITLRAIKLHTATDRHDTLTSEEIKYMFNGSVSETEGQIFILSDIQNSCDKVYIVSAPDCILPTIRIEAGELIIKSYGCQVDIGECEIGNAEALCRSWYRTFYKSGELHTMSNTWGDRNGRTRVRDDFIRREIDTAAEIGLDAVQIDDGWQQGVPNKYDSEGFRVFDEGFWNVKGDIFPQGIKPLADYAREKDVKLGLWFAPHSRGNFEYYSRDISVLETAYRQWGIRYFKLDMLQLETPEKCKTMQKMLEDIYSFGDDVSVELDVTADKRLGYLTPVKHGTLFVENRYTEWSNYYPHRTLRNLWKLSRFIPVSKTEFEIVNPELARDKYSSDDPFRPELFDMDYLFASVMFSNPLFWMEVQFLSEKSKKQLLNILPPWRQYRKEFSSADVYPIGEEPSGASMTGFVADCGSYMHILLLRECTERNEFTFDIGARMANIELIASNSDGGIMEKGKSLTVSFGAPRTYIWLKARKR